MSDVGKLMVIAGGVLVAVGLAIMLLGKTGLPLGRLPGDVVYKGKNTVFYFPLATSIVLSVLLSIVLYVCRDGAARVSALISMKVLAAAQGATHSPTKASCLRGSSFFRMAAVHCGRWALLTNLGSVSGRLSGGCGPSATWWLRCGRTSSGSMATHGWRGRSPMCGRRIQDIFISR